MLLDGVKEKKKKKKRERKEEEEEEEAFDAVEAEKRQNVPLVIPIKRKAKLNVDERFATVSMEDWEALLLEIARRSAAQDIEMPVGVPIPNEIRQEAIRQGARGPALSLWIATVAALLAAGAALGPQGALQVPRTLGAIMSSARTQGRGGFHHNAAAELDILLEGGVLRKLTGSTGAGEFFPGILG